MHRTQLKASYVQVEGDSKTIVIGAGTLQDTWTLLGTQIYFNGSLVTQPSPADAVSSTEQVTCVRYHLQSGAYMYSPELGDHLNLQGH